MSATSGTITELLFAYGADYTALDWTGVTTEKNLLTGGPRPRFEPKFWGQSNSSIGKTVSVQARGVVSVTGTPTFRWRISLNTGAWDVVGGSGVNIIARTHTLTMQSGIANAHWWLWADFVITAYTSTFTISTAGLVFSPGGIGTPFIGNIGGSTYDETGGQEATKAVWTTASLNPESTYYLGLSAQCSAASASNTIFGLGGMSCPNAHVMAWTLMRPP